MTRKPMRVYYDAEFLEQSGNVDVISMGFVRDDGKELYFVLDSFDTLAVARHDWLMKNVMPSIGHIETTSHITGTGQPVKDIVVTDPSRISRAHARHKIMEFVSDIIPEWWAWYGAYDHVALCSLFGRMIDLPSGWPMYTQDIRQFRKLAGDPPMPKQPEGLHNALEDARFNVVRYNYLVDKMNPPKDDPRVYIVARSQREGKTFADEHYSEYKTFVFSHPDHARGARIRGGVDHVVRMPGVVVTEEMEMNITLATR